MESGLNFIWMMIQTIFALAVVCGLAYLLFRVVLPKFNLVGSGGNMVRVVDRVQLDARKSLCVVEVAGKWMLVGVSDNGVQLVAELDSESARIAEEELSSARDSGAGGFSTAALTEKIAQSIGKKREGK
ncbi:MAG: flagellar biosynthetic protein FliO [Pyrinomonadaceae bacterium]|nr:flagellar biosynthetic protein FliO [Pyrinomonadaceae bacterium]